MASDNVQTIMGIGPVIAKTLDALNIQTVQDFVQASPEQLINVPNSYVLIQRAKAHIKVDEPTTATTEKELSYERFFITNHTWWEKSVRVPDLNTHELQTCILYELCVEAFNRVSLMCAWLPTQNTETLSTMTYSPQMIAYFNPKLPVLALQLSQTEQDQLTNLHTINNVLWETAVLLKHRNKTNKHGTHTDSREE
jgi:nucleotidyltransferase/DNA polymerase involved in DNA repair